MPAFKKGNNENLNTIQLLHFKRRTMIEILQEFLVLLCNSKVRNLTTVYLLCRKHCFLQHIHRSKNQQASPFYTFSYKIGDTNPHDVMSQEHSFHVVVSLFVHSVCQVVDRSGLNYRLVGPTLWSEFPLFSTIINHQWVSWVSIWYCYLFNYIFTKIKIAPSIDNF